MPRKSKNQPQSQLIDGNSGRLLRAFNLSDDLFAIERPTGDMHIIPKDRVSNLFRRDGIKIRYIDRGLDSPPEDSEQYCAIEEVEELCTKLTRADRKAAKDAITEDERLERPESMEPRHLMDPEPPKRD